MRERFLRAVLTSFATVLATVACTSPEHEPSSMASTVTFGDQWASAADTGMAAVFGTLTNNGNHDAVITSGRSPAAGRVEVHEVVPGAAGTATMRPKAGGVTVPAGGTHVLVPGGDHLMLMDLTRPLPPGADVELTVVFADGSTLPVDVQVRDFPGANEDYSPGHHDHG